jgi:hypothetical protein
MERQPRWLRPIGVVLLLPLAASLVAPLVVGADCGPLRDEGQSGACSR